MDVEDALSAIGEVTGRAMREILLRIFSPGSAWENDASIPKQRQRTGSEAMVFKASDPVLTFLCACFPASRTLRGFPFPPENILIDFLLRMESRFQ